jgi:hypothetical protein
VQTQYVIQERNVTHLEAHSTGVKEEEIRWVDEQREGTTLTLRLCCHCSTPLRDRTVWADSCRVCVPAAAARPAIDFLSRHLGLGGPEEESSQRKEGLSADAGAADDLAEVQFPDAA